MRKAVVESLLLSRRQRSALPQTLIFFVTSRCNARCSFCLYYEQITNPVAKKEELTPAEVERIADAYGPLHYLALSGGEPFVRKDLGDLVQPFIDRCGVRVVDIPSNFYYGKTMVETLGPLTERNPEVVFDLQMSIDHIGAQHDESRRVKGLYERAVASFGQLEELRARRPNLRLKINMVYLDFNREHLSEIVSQLAGVVDFDRIQLTYPTEMLDGDGENGDGETPAETRQSIADFIAAERAAVGAAPVRQRFDPYTLGMRSVKALYHRLLADAVAGGANVGSYCEAGRHIVVINEKGDVFPCEPLWHNVGNLRDNDYDLRRVLEAEAYRRFRERHLGPGKCNCTWGCAIHSSISVRSKYLPRLGLNALRMLAAG